MNMREYNILNFNENPYYRSPSRVQLDKMKSPQMTKTEIKFFKIRQRNLLRIENKRDENVAPQTEAEEAL